MESTRANPGEAARAFACTYLALEGAGIVAFWAVLWLVPGVRSHFVMAGAPDATFLAFVLADAVFLPVAAWAGAWAIKRGARWTVPLLWLHAGAAVYAALIACGMWVFDRTLWLGAGLMLPLLLFPVVIASAFTRAISSNGAMNGCDSGVNNGLTPLVRTAWQVLVFWTFFLAVVPAAIGLVERELGVPVWEGIKPWRRLAAGAMFAGASAIGLWSATAMAIRGRGTPLPTDPAVELVTTGPYAWVRNPMAVAGLLQGLSVAIYLGSGLTLAYVLLGCAIWQVAVRPQEERELLARFGERYEAYRRRVRCWLPRWGGDGVRVR
ncbi:MAG: isoprenylcysteine carboxylmethyltransferase family protein [Phycisphaeraceae bacterium]|nr:MAG: isoprenylcysteine carboxylmethyltransferase family protein [Phycisphaeraceae bacterium]